MPRSVHSTITDAKARIPSTEPISMRILDACRYTGISRSTLYVLIAHGQVDIIKLGRSTLVVTESLRKFVADRTKSHRHSLGGMQTRRSN